MAGNRVAGPPLSTNYSDTHSNSSSLSDKALHTLRPSLFRFTTKANQYCEQATVPVRQYIRPYHQSGSAYRWYGMADAINLSVSLCSLFYLFKHAYQHSSQILSPQEFQLALNEFHEAEKTPEGLGLAVLFSVFLVGFSTLGSFYDEKKDAPWVKHLVFYWPYVRDAGKQLKWWDKGWWAFLMLMLQYGVMQQEFILQIFFPLALIGGIFSAINRVWLRWVRDQRKDMVKVNLDVIEGLKAPLHQLDKMPKLLYGFENSLIFLPDAKELHYINDKAEADLVVMEDDEWEDFCTQLTELQTANVQARMKQFLRYHLSQEQAVHPRTRTQSTAPEQSVDNTIEHTEPPSQLRLHFIGDMKDLILSEQTMEAISTQNRVKKRDCTDKKFFDSYVYLSKTEDATEQNRLYYITKTGEVVAEQEISKLFHQKYQEVQQDKNVLNLSTAQVKSIQHSKILERKLGYTFDEYKKFLDFRADLLDTNSEQCNEKIQNQHAWVRWFGPFSAGVSAIGDGLYFYIFVAKMTIAILSPPMVFLMLGSSVALFAICMITRIAEEFDFRRRLDITILRPEAELSKKDCAMLHTQLEYLLDKQEDELRDDDLSSMISALEFSRGHRKIQLERHRIETTQLQISTESLSQHKKAILLLWNELHDELKLSKGLQDQLRGKLDRSYWEAALQGLQNGLAVQGAIASFSFMISSLCYVSAATFPPAFMIGCLVLGIAAIIVSCLQSCISHYFYMEKVVQTKLELSLEFHEEMLTKMTGESTIVSTDRDLVSKAMNYVNNHPLEPAVDFVVIEWSEIFRLFFKGAVKGKNAAFELFGRLLEGSDNKWMLPIIAVTGMITFAGALGMRAAAKGFAVGRPDSNTVSANNSEPKARNFFDAEKKTPTKTRITSLALTMSTMSDGEEEPEDVTPSPRRRYPSPSPYL